MIPEGSRDTGGCRKFSFAITGINYILKYIIIWDLMIAALGETSFERFCTQV